MRWRGARALLLGLLVVGGLAGTTGPAAAHPLGNFTTNAYAGLVVRPDGVDLDYVVDLAEVPTVRLVQEFDTDGDGAVGPAEGEAYRDDECGRLAAGLTLTLDGAAVPLSVTTSNLTFPPGQAGLATSRLECRTTAPGDTAGRTTVTLTDANHEGQIGWREITAVGDGMTLASSDVPAESISGALRAYPEERLASPLDVRSAAVVARDGGGAAVGGIATTVVPGPVGRGIDRYSTAFTDLVARQELTVSVAALGLVLAVGLGGLHAVAPGHGKTVMAAVLVSRDGSLRQALALGLTVATTHTMGVALLGVVFSVVEVLSPDRVFAWLGVASGLLFAAVGVTLLRTALVRRGGHDHDHPHDHGHNHPQDHEPDRELVHAGGSAPHVHEHDTHAPVPADTHGDGVGHSPSHHGHPHPVPLRGGVRWRQLVAPGLAGGLVPSPSALLVLLGGIALDRAWFGLTLVIAYGVGMAAVLVGAGYLLLRARTRITARAGGAGRLARLTAVLPVATATLVIVAGLAIAARSLLVA